MSIVTVEVLFIFILTLLNGVFAMSEIALVSSRKARLQQWAESGNRKARLALDIANAPETFLSTVQIGITLVGVLAGAFGGATIASHLAAFIEQTPALVPYAETLAVGLIVLAITYVSLVLGELVPKRIALSNAERIATLVAGPMRLLARITAPVVWLLNVSSNAIVWLLPFRPAPQEGITEEEIRILIRQGTDAGTIHRDERTMIDRVFRFSDRRVSSIMTPRTRVTVLFTTDGPVQLREKIGRGGFASYPLCEGTHDNVLGIVRAQDILGQILSGKEPDLRAVVRQPLVLPESIGSLKLLEEFRWTGKDTAILLDEYGGLQGLVTANDLLRALAGDVVFSAEPSVVPQADGSWLVDGMLPVDDLMDLLRPRVRPDTEGVSFDTAGGFLVSLFLRIPAEGDTIVWDRYRFTVTGMDDQRIGRIHVAPVQTGKEE